MTHELAQKLFNKYGNMLINNPNIKSGNADPELDKLIAEMLASTENWNQAHDGVVPTRGNKISGYTVIMNDFCTLLWAEIETQKNNQTVNSFSDIANHLIKWLHANAKDFNQEFIKEQYQLVPAIYGFNSHKDKSESRFNYITGKGVFESLGITLSRDAENVIIGYALNYSYLHLFKVKEDCTRAVKVAMGVPADYVIGSNESPVASKHQQVQTPAKTKVQTEAPPVKPPTKDYSGIIGDITYACVNYSKHLAEYTEEQDEALNKKREVVNKIIDILTSDNPNTEEKMQQFNQYVIVEQHGKTLQPRRDSSKLAKRMEYLFHIITLGVFSKISKGTFAFWKSHGEVVLNEITNLANTPQKM